jgi:hypothetical protein
MVLKRYHLEYDNEYVVGQKDEFDFYIRSSGSAYLYLLSADSLLCLSQVPLNVISANVQLRDGDKIRMMTSDLRNSLRSSSENITVLFDLVSSRFTVSDDNSDLSYPLYFSSGTQTWVIELNSPSKSYKLSSQLQMSPISPFDLTKSQRDYLLALKAKHLKALEEIDRQLGQ